MSEKIVCVETYGLGVVNRRSSSSLVAGLAGNQTMLHVTTRFRTAMLSVVAAVLVAITVSGCSGGNEPVTQPSESSTTATVPLDAAIANYETMLDEFKSIYLSQAEVTDWTTQLTPRRAPCVPSGDWGVGPEGWGRGTTEYWTAPLGDRDRMGDATAAVFAAANEYGFVNAVPSQQTSEVSSWNLYTDDPIGKQAVLFLAVRLDEVSMQISSACHPV